MPPSDREPRDPPAEGPKWPGTRPKAGGHRSGPRSPTPEEIALLLEPTGEPGDQFLERILLEQKLKAEIEARKVIQDQFNESSRSAQDRLPGTGSAGSADSIPADSSTPADSTPADSIPADSIPADRPRRPITSEQRRNVLAKAAVNTAFLTIPWTACICKELYMQSITSPKP